MDRGVVGRMEGQTDSISKKPSGYCWWSKDIPKHEPLVGSTS